MDTRVLKPLRDAQRWKEAVGRLSETRAFPGIPEAVEELRRGPVAWGIVTTSVSYYAGAVLKHHDLAGDYLIAYHDVSRRKPDPESIVLALEKMGVDAPHAIGVGDALVDIQAYHAAGIKALGAGWSPTLAEGEWDAVLATPQDLLDLLA